MKGTISITVDDKDGDIEYAHQAGFRTVGDFYRKAAHQYKRQYPDKSKKNNMDPVLVAKIIKVVESYLQHRGFNGN